MTEEMNEKVLKSLEKLADQQNRKLKVVDRCGDDPGNLANLLKLVKEGHVRKASVKVDFEFSVSQFVHYRYSQLSYKMISKRLCS